MRLDFISASILYLLWKRRRNKDGRLVSARTLLGEMTDGLAGENFRKDLPIMRVKKALLALAKEGVLEKQKMVREGTESGTTKSDSGPPPNGYRLAADAPVITWRSSAAITMYLHNHPDRRVQRKRLVDEIAGSGISHHNADEPLSPAEVDEQIDYCRKTGYIAEIEPTSEEVPSLERLLQTTTKVDEQRMFIEKIANEVKRQAQAATRMDESVEGKKADLG